jgi:hypothetical protein
MALLFSSCGIRSWNALVNKSHYWSLRLPDVYIQSLANLRPDRLLLTRRTGAGLQRQQPRQTL